MIDKQNAEQTQSANKANTPGQPIANEGQPRLARLMLFAFLALIGVLFLVLPGQAALENMQITAAGATNTLGPAYGVDFITSAEGHADEKQFENALATGATWDRWPMYWSNIEVSPGDFDWARQDKAIEDDLAHELQVNALLLGTPAFYTTSFLQRPSTPYQQQPRAGDLSLNALEKATPQGLYEPVFLDGDVPGPSKVINPNNKWAVFVEKAVNRYKPGGILAQANDWPENAGVTHWEMWNEPDLTSFWDASLADYARLLKVGYLAAKHADGEATVMFAGLAMFMNLNYYDEVLDIYDSDSLAESNSFFHDITTYHNYFVPERTAYYAGVLSKAMAKRNLDKPLWLNESGVAAWDDYPGPIWEPMSPLRATQEEQAAFAIQSAFHGLSAGVDTLFHFQLYDGCGNQPQGTDFPPHNGELCDEDNEYNGLPCAGDANGLYRNPTDAACFTQHPFPESARPVFSAYKVLTSYVKNVKPYWQKRAGTPLNSTTCPGSDGPQEWIALYQPATQKRIVGLWARCEQTETAVIQATAPDGKAQLVAADGSVQVITATNGAYTITLPRATHRNPFPGQTINPTFPIGGSPYILIETDHGAETPTPTATSTLPPDCNQVVINGGFEDDSGWTIPNTVFPARYSSAMAYAGNRSLEAGIINDGDDVESYSTAQQTITVPLAAGDQTLHVQLYTQSSESTPLNLPADPLATIADRTALESDRQMILLLDLEGHLLKSLLMERLDNRSWQAYSFDLSAFAGDSVILYLSVYNNGQDGVTGMYVDDVHLGNCNLTPTPTATMPADLPFKSYAPLAVKN